MDPTAKQSIVDRLKQATNVLVTVKSDPSVDQLAGAIGFTLFLNKLGKHATAVYSGDTPSTIEFLKPEETLEKNTDSLRDFIIALDKSKADKLRYKVEDKVVKIFITPYKTSISEKDLDFSQGDFNVDVVIAIGVHAKEDLDQAIIAHGRILHDATVISMNNGPGGNVGTLHLEDPGSSSLSEMLADIGEILQPDAFDAQMATAYLTGIVAETNRFSNNKTSPQTMTLSAKLMAAGANQQLIATQLQPGMVAGGQTLKKKKQDEEGEDGTLLIDHDDSADIELPTTLPEPQMTQAETPIVPPVSPAPPIVPSDSINNVRPLIDSSPVVPPTIPTQQPSDKFPLAPPTMGGTLTANTQQINYEPPTDPLSQGQVGQTLEHGQTPIGIGQTGADLDDKLIKEIEKTVGSEHPTEDSTINEWEKAVDSPHVQTGEQASPPNLDVARQAVEQAAANSSDTITPLKAVGSSPLDLDVQGAQTPPPLPPAPSMPTDILADRGMPPEQTGANNDQPTPPPVPPPIIPPLPPTTA